MSSIYPYRFHIGMQKTGSTYLYNLLKKHPDISLPIITEVNFFSANYEKGLEWYLNQFKSAGARIDTSPKYFMLGKNATARIKKYSLKYLTKTPLFLLILRNPIDYLNSHFQMHLLHGHFKKNSETYPDAPENLVEFIKKYPQYLERAFYFKILKNNWLAEFDLSQFKIIIFEDFIKNTNQNVQEILSFFGLPKMDLKISPASKNKLLKYKFLHNLKGNLAKNEKLKNYLKNSKCVNYILDNFLTKKSSEKLSAEDRLYLKNIFQSDVAELKNLLGREIPEWKDFR